MASAWTTRRRLALAGLLAAMGAAMALAWSVSLWFVAPLPLLGGAAYAVILGMSPGRFVDALDDASGTGTHPPL